MIKNLYLQPIPDSLSDQSHSVATETTLLDKRADELYEHMQVHSANNTRKLIIFTQNDTHNHPVLKLPHTQLVHFPGCYWQKWSSCRR